MPEGGDSSHATWLQRHPRVPFVAVLGLLAVLTAADELTPATIRFGPLMVAAPGLAAVFCSPGYVLLVAAATVGCVVASAEANVQLDALNFPIQLATAVAIGAVAIVAAAVRQRGERQLAQVRWVAEVTQRTLLRPLPSRVGTLAFSSMYMAADEEAEIGGDVYAVADLDATARVMIGDAQGKGMAALESVTYLLSAFRRAAREDVPLNGLGRCLENAINEDLLDAARSRDCAAQSDPGLPQAFPETFVTAVVADVPTYGRRLQLVNRGHPAPLLLHDGGVRELAPAVPAVPLGLGDLDGVTVAPVLSADFLPGDTLLLYTDGLIEARDETGNFYPLADRLRSFAGYAPDDLLNALRADLLRHVRGRLTDDVAVVAVHRTQ